MEESIRAGPAGRLSCPQCKTRLGQFSWTTSQATEQTHNSVSPVIPSELRPLQTMTEWSETGVQDCGCGAVLAPAFTLDLTAVIFRTGSRHLQPGALQPRAPRQPVLV